MKCDIIIPIWDQLTFTRDCIEHIYKNTIYPYRLILIDNASGEETRRYLEGLRDDRKGKSDGSGIVLIRNDENLGYIKAINQGLAISDAPYVCMMNNDTIPARGWLERMIDFAIAHKDVGLINPQCNGHRNTPMDTYARMLEKNRGKYMEMNQCQGFCMLVKRELIDKIGSLDEAFGIGGYDDTDYSMRAHLAGFRSVAINDSYVYHRQHVSFNKAGNREDWVQRNRQIYYNKWGKHLRLCVAVNLKDRQADEMKRVARMAYGLAREWSWVHVWLNSKCNKKELSEMMREVMDNEGLPPHQNIRFDYFDMPGFIFGAVMSGKIVERMRNRMRDKRFDAIISVDGAATSTLKYVAGIAGVRVMDICDAKISSDWLAAGRDLACIIKDGRVSRARAAS